MEACIRQSSGAGKPGLQTSFDSLQENCFYYLDGETTAALARAIEELALEEANGHLLAAFQDFNQFEMQRERYQQLALTLDGLQVIAAGKTPRPIRRLDFLRDPKGACRSFCALAYRGKRGAALMVGRQADRLRRTDATDFIGFQTFNPDLVGRLWQQLLDVAKGRSPGLREFDRLLAIDRATKQMRSEFARQKEAVEQAMHRLQVEGDRYPTRSFAADLEKEFIQFQKWRLRLPDLLARSQGG